MRIQFAWQRGQGANPGGIAHDTDARGSAPGDDSSGTWARVAEALADPNWGSQFTPRIGTEVLVDFIDNDMDRPLVMAQLYTGADQLPYAAGVESGANHGGTLSGIHSHNVDGGGYNQWQLDDTPGQVRPRLATSSAVSQLNLGYLIHQAPSSSQRGAYRGSSFELRTDAWAVVRGAKGVLLTTSARGAQGSGVASTQMDAAEAVGATVAKPAASTPAAGEAVWHDPLAVCTLRTAHLASKTGAKFDWTRQGGKRCHQGIDLVASPGTTIYAVANGVVHTAPAPNASYAYGHTLVLEVGIEDLPPAQAAACRKVNPGAKTIGFFYAHLSELPANRTLKVYAGDPIGKSGCTGNAKDMKTVALGAHLHFEVRKDALKKCGGLDNRVDPLLFIQNCTNNP